MSIRIRICIIYFNQRTKKNIEVISWVIHLWYIIYNIDINEHLIMENLCMINFSTWKIAINK